MVELSAEQRILIDEVARRLGAIPGVAAVVLGGSFARGCARPDSDIDLGVLYSEHAPFAVDELRALAGRLHDHVEPVVTDFYAWGPWVNGGAWLTIRGQRVDWLYRSVEHLARTIDAAEAGRYELHYGQQPPFGFFSGTYLGELSIAVPLIDSLGHVAALKRRVATYPDALRRAVVQNYLWAAELNIESFAPKFAAQGDALGTAGCLARAAHQLELVLFALNRRHLLSDKTALAEIATFALAPRDFSQRITAILAKVGATGREQLDHVEAMASLIAETVALCGDLYRRPYPNAGPKQSPATRERDR